MLFEILNANGQTVFNTTQTCALPCKKHIDMMSKLGYSFSVDGKKLSKKTLNEFIKQEDL